MLALELLLLTIMHIKSIPALPQRTLDLFASMPWAIAVLLRLSSFRIIGMLIAQNRNQDDHHSIYGNFWQKVITLVKIDA